MVTQKRILIIYYSYSSQTRKLIYAYSAGLEEGGVAVTVEQLKTRAKIQFPLGSIASTVRMMVETFFRKRLKVVFTSEKLKDDWDLILLAGPTWSYNPSGPILSFLDNHGSSLEGKKVLPFISCRGYWRMHFWQLRSLLRKNSAQVLGPLVFLHTGPEPWRTIGVFLKMAGRIPESDKSWLGKYYPRFGHTKEQVNHARNLGREFAYALIEDRIDFSRNPVVVKEVESVSEKP